MSNEEIKKQNRKVADNILTELKKDKNFISHQLNKDEETSFNTGFFRGFDAAIREFSLSGESCSESIDPTRCQYEQFIEKFFGKNDFEDRTEIKTDFGMLVNLLCAFDQHIKSCSESIDGQKVYEIDEVFKLYVENGGKISSDLFLGKLKDEGYKLIKSTTQNIKE